MTLERLFPILFFLDGDSQTRLQRRKNSESTFNVACFLFFPAILTQKCCSFQRLRCRVLPHCRFFLC